GTIDIEVIRFFDPVLAITCRSFFFPVPGPDTQTILHPPPQQLPNRAGLAILLFRVDLLMKHADGLLDDTGFAISPVRLAVALEAAALIDMEKGPGELFRL